MKWISVEDELPKRNISVIGYDQFYSRVGECKRADWGQGHLIFTDRQKDDCSITHWMPMPEPPKVRKEGE